MADPVIQLPYRIIEVDETLPIRLQKNFDEIVRLLGMLQVYENKTGKPVNDQVAQNSLIWDRANNITAEGKWLTTKLQGAIDAALNLTLAGAGSVTITDNNGIMIVDNKDAPTKALRLLGGVFAIANSKKPDGTWDWRTFGTGDGFVADLITSGKILTSLVNIVGDKYFTKILGDGFRVYDKNGALAGHFGYYETLADQTATFTRSSIAYKQDGSQVTSGTPRYEYAALPAPVWQDTFDTNQLSQYTSGGDSPATWAVSGGVLTATGGSQATLIKNDLLLQDCEIVVNSDQAYDGGIVVRYQDNNNYYLLAIRDDSSGATPNLAIYKRVAGTYTQLADADVTWARGTAKPIKFSCKGSTLEAYFDGVKVISVTDTTFTGGGVGLRQHTTTAGNSTRFLDFTVYYASLGVTSEEGATNIVASWPTGWTVSGDAGMAATDMGVQPGAAGNTVRLTNSGATEGFYSSPLFALSPSTTYTIRIKVRGTANVNTLDIYVLSNTGTLIQHSSRPTYLNSVFQTYSATFTTTADITGTNQYIRFDHNGNDAGYIEIAEVTLIQKAYALSFPGYGATRSPEALTVPTAGVFNKGNWTVKLRFTPTSKQDADFNVLWYQFIDDNNWYRLGVWYDGRIWLQVRSGGLEYTITGGSVFQVGNTYFITASGNGSVLRLCVNGVQIGVDTDYVEPVGSLPVNMYIGTGPFSLWYANGIISDFAVMSKAQTLAEHQAEYTSGLPLSVDDATTYLMSCNGTLQPTVRDFGLWLAGGEIGVGAKIAGNNAGDLETKTGAQGKVDSHNALQSPHNLPSYAKMQSDGFKVFDNLDQLRCHMGQYAAGKYGLKVVNGEIYSTTVRTGAETDTTYIALVPPGTFIAKVNNNTILRMEAGIEDGNLYLGKKDGTGDFGRILRYTDVYPGLAIESVGTGLSLRSAGNIDTTLGSSTNVFTAHGNFNAVGGSKNCVEETSQGMVALSVRESPDIRYIDENTTNLVNGECRIDIDPIFLECVLPNSNETPWLIHLTQTTPEIVYVSEIGDTYFTVKSSDVSSNASFFWKLSAIRKGYSGIRFQKFYAEGDVLTSNWEDEILMEVGD